MDRVGLVFLLCLGLCYVVSMAGKPNTADSSVSLDDVSFATGKNFNVAALGVILILTVLYATWW
jgi:SSS family solute:Na+ symporter